MQIFNRIQQALVVTAALFAIGKSTSAHALELEWSGQFRAEYHFLKNYTLDSTDNGAQVDLGRMQKVVGANGQTVFIPTGYYIPGGGSSNSSFETVFLRLKPKVVVNDNVYIKSEFWLGDPVYGIFGNAYPGSFDQRQFYSTQSRGSAISAQRFWLEALTDFGTVQVGRAPLDWGLGLFWNAGEGQWDRYESTADQIRLISKFGSFTVSPGIAVYSTGNSLGGSCAFNVTNPTNGAPICSPNGTFGGVTDYNILLKYENIEEDFEGGINFVRRIGGGGQDPNSGALGLYSPDVVPGMAFNTWDLYAKKKLGKFNLAAEAPIVSGQIGGQPYSAFAIAAELGWKISDTWGTGLKAGHAPGQNDSLTQTPDKFSAYYFNPNYRIANIMFNYALANLSGAKGANTLNNPGATQSALLSPFDDPIVNANYFSWTGALHVDKWTFDTGLTYAYAQQHAIAGEWFYNTFNRRQEFANQDQSTSLGFEWDLGAGFQWDETFLFRLDLGLFKPGGFFQFSNAPVGNDLSTLYNAQAKIGVNF